MAEYSVVEMFESINGEGPRTGQLTLFVRMKGCNLDCGYCDTTWANADDAAYKQMSAEEILATVHNFGIRNVTLTGGEPLLQRDMAELIHALTDDPYLRVEVETNGSIPLAPLIMELKTKEIEAEGEIRKSRREQIPYAERRQHLSFNMDYKLPGSGMEKRMCAENFTVLCAWDTVKFVVSDRRDLVRARELIAEHRLTETCRVFLSPVFGMIDPQEIVAFMKEYRMNDVSLQLQMHKIIWNPNERGV